MDKALMVDNLNRQLPMALDELNEHSIIDDCYRYMISNEAVVNFDKEKDTDTIISISLYYLDSEGIKLVLTGIDCEGVVDLINKAEPTETGLETLLEQFDNIVIKKKYTEEEALETGFMG